MFLVIECVIIHADAKIGSAGFIMYSFVAPGICVAIAEFYRWEKTVFEAYVNRYLATEKVTSKQLASGTP